jgi:FMN phosphatase YigB (HAD superfamily)
MPLSIDQYASYLDTRDLPWPIAPPPRRAKARPHLEPVTGLRVVLWNVYGTLLAISEGNLVFEVADPFHMDVALTKTIDQFKMWNSMSRKPGQPSAYMREILQKVLAELRLAPSPGEKYPEIAAERVWENIVKKLFQKEYAFDERFFGSLAEFSQKVAYFYHSSLQGTSAYPGAADAVTYLARAGLQQGLLTDGQCFTAVQLQRALRKQDPGIALDELVPPARRWISGEQKVRKPSASLFESALQHLAKEGIEASEVMHVGSNMDRDIIPAKAFGMRTALFAGDRTSLSATPEQLKHRRTRPDVLLTEYSQLAQVIG